MIGMITIIHANGDVGVYTQTKDPPTLLSDLVGHEVSSHLRDPSGNLYQTFYHFIHFMSFYQNRI